MLFLAKIVGSISRSDSMHALGVCHMLKRRYGDTVYYPKDALVAQNMCFVLFIDLGTMFLVVAQCLRLVSCLCSFPVSRPTSRRTMMFCGPCVCLIFGFADGEVGLRVSFPFYAFMKTSSVPQQVHVPSSVRTR